jgi:hypothetical protein
VTLNSAIDDKGDTMPAVKAFGTGFTQSNVAGSAELVPADPAVTRRFLLHAEGGQIWVSFGAAPNAGAEPRGFLSSGKSVLIDLEPTHSIRVAAANLT